MSDAAQFIGAGRLVVAGEELVADPQGGLFWPASSLLAVADLHFEKGAAFAAKGVMLPPYDTSATLGVVERLVARYRPDTVIALGDSFHRDDSHRRLGRELRGRIQDLTSACRWIWISGNHDPAPPQGLGGEAAGEIAIGPLVFRHAPGAGESAGESAGEIAGHLHPVAKLRQRGRSIRRRCFAADARRVVMPAIGAYSGGLNVLDQAFAAVFAGRDFHAWMMGGGRVYPLAASRLAADPPERAWRRAVGA